jgi:chemotaxis protein methyltransferase CheR
MTSSPLPPRPPLAGARPAVPRPAPPLPSRTPTLGAADFDVVRALVRERAGIVLEPGKEYLVESRLSSLVRSQGFASIAELVSALRLRRPGLADAVVDAMTTNETSFFRDVHPFEALRTTIIPELIAARRATRELSIWCAASSSGQEPVSLAMLLREHFPELTGWRLRILATDISPSMLDKCRAGRFSQLEVNRGLPASYLVKYFSRAGADWVVNPEVQRMIEYRFLNLMSPFPALGRLDLVLIRNVLIYFDIETKRRVLGGIKKVLRPDGVLMLGSSETTMNIDEGWAGWTIGRTIAYRPR